MPLDPKHYTKDTMIDRKERGQRDNILIMPGRETHWDSLFFLNLILEKKRRLPSQIQHSKEAVGYHKYSKA